MPVGISPLPLNISSLPFPRRFRLWGEPPTRPMKALIALFTLIASALAQEHIAEITMPVKMGKKTWVMQRSQYLITLLQKDPARTAVNRDPDELLKLRFSKHSAPEVSKILEKFTEWAAVARKNAIRDFAKPIEGSDPTTQGLVFTVNNGRISLVKKEEYPEKVSEFTEQDIADMKVLLANLPQLEALFEKGPPKSPADALFK